MRTETRVEGEGEGTTHSVCKICIPTLLAVAPVVDSRISQSPSAWSLPPTTNIEENMSMHACASEDAKTCENERDGGPGGHAVTDFSED